MKELDKKTFMGILLCAFIAIFLMTGSWRVIQHYFESSNDSVPEKEIINISPPEY